MSVTEAQMCPWISILPQADMQELNKENQVLSLIKLLVKVTLEAVNIYETKKLAHLDALIGNYGCEVHTFNIYSLIHSTELTVECHSMKTTCAEIVNWVRRRQSTRNPKSRDQQFGPLNQVYNNLQGMSTISDRMMYLIQSRFLTITKEYTYDNDKFDERDYEGFWTRPENLRKLVRLSVDDTLLDSIVSKIKSSMSKSSILFLRARLDMMMITDGEEGTLVKKMMSDEYLCSYLSVQASHRIAKRGGDASECIKTYSCSYYNAKALLLLLAELEGVLIVKKVTKLGEPVNYHAFRALSALGQFEEMPQEQMDQCLPETPVVVCTAYIPDDLSNEEWLEKVRKYGLGNMILANISQGSQYVPDKPEVFSIQNAEAAEEISMQSTEKAVQLECIWMKDSIFDVDHFYCSTWGNRGENVSESQYEYEH